MVFVNKTHQAANNTSLKRRQEEVSRIQKTVNPSNQYSAVASGQQQLQLFNTHQNFPPFPQNPPSKQNAVPNNEAPFH